jgi:signal transduction histidine kinase
MRTDRDRRWFYAAGWLISAGVMVVTFRMWQLHVREVEQRAAEAERTKDEAAQRRAMEERLRIARELHDSLTHSISVIQVQAGVAEHLARKRGEEVPPVLLAIGEASADAARELRATLGALRSVEDGDRSGLCQLDSLVARARAAGLPVTVTVTGAERPLPPEVDQAAYRIVQEALTNVSRHAGFAGSAGLSGGGLAGGGQVSASVRLQYTPHALIVEVSDDGKGSVNGSGGSRAGGSRPAGPGLGLIGMRERVSALGGRLAAGPRDSDGFQVRAELPARAQP